ncbi:MAG: hypothetical protein ACW97P_03380 [Candidatus Hodarchaeales archaeon]|jgi:hypothetical protein
MFDIFKKKNTKRERKPHKKITIDGIEKSLWDIKEVYDLETEEIEKVVLEKREFNEKRKEIERNRDN